MQIEYRINDINIYYKTHNYGYAFIEFDSVKIAKRVIQKYNGRVVSGQYLKLNIATPNLRYPKKKHNQINKNEIWNIFQFLY